MALTQQQIDAIQKDIAARKAAGTKQGNEQLSSAYTGVGYETPQDQQGSVFNALASGIKSVVTQVPKVAVQFPRALVAGAAGLAGALGSETGKKVEEQFSRPISVPGLGEVGALSADPTAGARFGAMTPRQQGAQALEFASSRVPGGKGILRGLLGGGASGFSPMTSR